MRIITAVIAIAFGALVLAGYFIPQLEFLQVILLNWAMLMVAAAAIVGVLNLVFVHADKIRRREKGNLYSAILVMFLVGTFMLGMIAPVVPGLHQVVQLVLNGIIFPVEAALMGILTITLLYAAVRLLRRRTDFTTMVFLITAALVLFGSATLPQPLGTNIPIISNVSVWIQQVLAVGGARGILIGVALGTLLTGIRVLLGIDRPYGGN